MATDGDDEFVSFVARRYAALVRTAYLLQGDRQVAEDVVQSALIKTLEAWDRLQDPSAAEAFTRTTLVRLLGRWGRRRWRGEVPTEDLPDGHEIVEDVVTSMDVRAALGRLQWEQRAALVLRYLDDLSEQDTAIVLRCSVGTVKSRTSRALSALRADGLLADGRIHQPEVPHG